MSSSSVKGLLKGLRYISHIFENEKKEEMVIGLPTDVKHVAHIGNDGPSSSSSTPSWMNQFQGRSETSSSASNNGKPPTKQTAKSSNKDSSIQGSRDFEKISEAPFESPNRGRSRQSRHHKSSPSRAGIGSPGRNHRRPSSSKLGAESPSRDPMASPKPTRSTSSSPGREVMDVEKPRVPKQAGIGSPDRKKYSNLESPRRRSSSKLGAESPSRATLASPGRTHKSSSSPGREVMDVGNPRHYKQAGSEPPGRKKQSNLESPRRSSPKFGAESPSRDTFASPKPTRRKKKTASSGEGARSKSKSKSTELQN